MIVRSEPYRPRSIRYLTLWDEQGWRLKVYGIAYDSPAIRPALHNIAKRMAFDRLQISAAGKGHYGVGFVGIHDGRGAVFIFVDFWADENELHHHVYVAPKEELSSFTYMTPTGLAACVWDLRVLCFERQAWLDTVLAASGQPDLDKYLEMHLNEQV